MNTKLQAPAKHTAQGSSAISHNEPVTLNEAGQDVVQRLLSRPLPRDPNPAELDLVAEEKERCRRARLERQFLESVGERYKSCSLDSFCTEGTAEISQRKSHAIDQCREFTRRLERHLMQGANVLIAGPAGTGKDHLLIAMARIAIVDCGAVTHWVNGQELFAEFRDAIDKVRDEKSIVREFTKPPLLLISDPIPPKGDASAFSVNALYRVVDERYRNMRPTWVSLNAASTEEAQQAISAPVFDRILDESFRLFLNWPSYRESRRLQWSDD